MKTRLITGFALAAAFLVAGPTYAKDNHREGGGKGHAVAAVHKGGGGGESHMHAMASAHKGGGGAHVASRGGNHGSKGGAVASRRTFNARTTGAVATDRNLTRNNVAGRNVTNNNVANRNMTRNFSHNSMAFGGSRNGGHGNWQYAFASHNGWNHGQEYFWHGHHYQWYNNGWFIIDPFGAYYGPDYGYNGPNYYGTYGNNGGSVSTQVQAALNQQGYYDGPVDGVIGPRTRAAIAAFQRDNGLPVTGTITPGLLNTLGVG